MTWRDYLSKKEQAELDRAERARDKAKTNYNSVRAKLKSRADARIRNRRKPKV